MNYKISTGDTIDIGVGDKVLLTDEYQVKLPGYLKVNQLFDSYLLLEIKLDKNDNPELIGFAPSLIKDVKNAKPPTDKDFMPLVKQVLQAELPALIETAVKNVIKDKLTQQFFDQLGAATVVATVQTEVAKALLKAAKAVDSKVK